MWWFWKRAVLGLGRRADHQASLHCLFVACQVLKALAVSQVAVSQQHRTVLPKMRRMSPTFGCSQGNEL